MMILRAHACRGFDRLRLEDSLAVRTLPAIGKRLVEKDQLTRTGNTATARDADLAYGRMIQTENRFRREPLNSGCVKCNQN